MKKRVLSILVAVLMVFALLPVPETGVCEAQADEGEKEPEIATWAGFRKGAVSFTFEDGAPSHISDVAPMFEKYGYRASFYLVTNWGPDWSGFQNLANKGHEIGSHSNSHGNNMAGEEATSKKKINDEIEQKYGCITVAYPNGNMPNKEAVLGNYIAGRTYYEGEEGTNDFMSKDGPTDWAAIPSIITGSTTAKSSMPYTTADHFTGKMQEAITNNRWIVFASFGLTGKKNGSATYSPTDEAAIDGALAWAQKKDEIWVAPLRDVAMYIKERKASGIDTIEVSDTSVTYVLQHSIANSISNFDYPLSLRVPMPEGWKYAKVYQADSMLQFKADDGWLYFDAIPNGGDIIVEKRERPDPTGIEGAEVVLSATTFTYNGNVQKPAVKTIGGKALTEGKDYTAEWSDASSKNAGEYSVTIRGTGDYTGTTGASYKIQKAEAKVAIPDGKNYTYDGTTKIGVATGEQYALGGTFSATDAGSYTTKVSLKADDNYNYKWADGTTAEKIVEWKIDRADNPLQIKTKKVKIKFKKVKKKAQKLAISKVISFTGTGEGEIAYKKVKGNKKITINKKTGKVKVKKGLKKGKYKVTVNVSAVGNGNYNPADVTGTFTIRIK